MALGYIFDFLYVLPGLDYLVVDPNCAPDVIRHDAYPRRPRDSEYSLATAIASVLSSFSGRESM